MRQTGRVAFALLALSAAAQAADRRVIVDPNAPPWNSIAKVQTNIGSRCTGVLVAPEIVLTAAHCLYNPRTRAMLQPVSLHVLFGYQRSTYRWHRTVRNFVVGSGFQGGSAEVQAADWARLNLSESVPVPPLPLVDGGVAAGLPAALAGYNQDKAQLLMADTDCRVLAVAALPDGAFVSHDCEGTRGTSGGPLLAQRNGKWLVIGINIAAGHERNLALIPPPGSR